MKMRAAKVSRDSILFLAGMAGIAYETLAQGGERPTLLLLFAAMVGLPAFLRSDERTQKTDTDDNRDQVNP